MTKLMMIVKINKIIKKILIKIKLKTKKIKKMKLKEINYLMMIKMIMYYYNNKL